MQFKKVQQRQKRKAAGKTMQVEVKQTNTNNLEKGKLVEAKHHIHMYMGRTTWSTHLHTVCVTNDNPDDLLT